MESVTPLAQLPAPPWPLLAGQRHSIGQRAGSWRPDVCAVPGCGTELARTNPTPTCAGHAGWRSPWPASPTGA